MRGTYFRAWDIEAKCYVQEPILVDNFGQVYVVCEEASKEEGTCLITGKPNVIIEQDTGLKDKNGKEIYEGNIVRIDSMDELRVGYVELVADQYCIVCGEDEKERKIVAEFYYYSKPEENCEVIGNIHENPELLEEK